MFNQKDIKTVLSLALPAVGEMILYMMIWVFDTMMVGNHSGELGVSSVGLSSELLYTFSNIFIAVGISIGITSLVARRFGAHQLNEAEEFATIGFCFGCIVAFLIFIINFMFAKNILTFAGANSNVLNLSTIYLKITSFGLFFNMLMNMLNALLRGYGNIFIPLLASLIINIINLTLDWILIFGKFGFPELGIKGAAIATFLAQLLGFIFVACYTFKYSKLKIRFKYIYNLKKHKLSELLKLSIPSSLQEGAFDISRLLSAFIIMHIGTTAFTSNQITTTIESLSFMPGWGFSVAATTLVGHKIGEKNIKKAKHYAYTCTILGVIVMSFCSLLFLFFPNFLIGLFINTTNQNVIHLGSLCLMIASVEQIPMAVSMILGGALKGLGNTKIPFIISFCSSWLIRLPLMFYFVYILKVSVIYVWWITAIQWTFEGIIMFIMFKKHMKSYKIND